MRHFKGWCFKSLKNNHFESGTRYFEDFRWTDIKLTLQIGTPRLGTDQFDQPVLTDGKHSKSWHEHVQSLFSTQNYRAHSRPQSPHGSSIVSLTNIRTH